MDSATTTLVRSDPTELAGAALRALGRNDRRNNRDRTLIYLLVAGITAAWLAGAMVYFWADAWDGVTIVALAAVVGSVAVAVFALRGVIATLLIITAAASVAVWSSWGILNWGGLLAGVALPVIGGVAAATSRRARLPRLAAVAGISVLTPVVYYLGARTLSEWAVLIAALGVAAAVAAQIDAPHYRKVRQASRRSGIPMSTASPFSLALLGVSGPSGVDAAQLKVQANAQRRTAGVLEQLGDEWFVFHSRVTPFGDLADHVVVGPPGVFVLQSDELPAHIDVDPDGVRINGELTGDTATAEHLCWCAIGIDTALMTPGGSRATRALYVAHDALIDGGQVDQRVEVNDQNDLVTYVTTTTAVPALRNHQDLGRGDQFVADLAAIVDYLLPIEK